MRSIQPGSWPSPCGFQAVGAREASQARSVLPRAPGAPHPVAKCALPHPQPAKRRLSSFAKLAVPPVGNSQCLSQILSFECGPTLRTNPAPRTAPEGPLGGVEWAEGRLCASGTAKVARAPKHSRSSKTRRVPVTALHACAPDCRPVHPGAAWPGKPALGGLLPSDLYPLDGTFKQEVSKFSKKRTGPPCAA